MQRASLTCREKPVADARRGHTKGTATYTYLYTPVRVYTFFPGRRCRRRRRRVRKQVYSVGRRRRGKFKLFVMRFPRIKPGDYNERGGDGGR